MRLSRYEFDMSTLRDVIMIIGHYREHEVSLWERHKQLAIIAGTVSNMPYMKEHDRSRLMRSLHSGDEQHSHEYSDEEVQAMLDDIARMEGREVSVTKADGTKIISKPIEKDDDGKDSGTA